MHDWSPQQIKTMGSYIEQIQTDYYGKEESNETRLPVALGVIRTTEMLKMSKLKVKQA